MAMAASDAGISGTANALSVTNPYFLSHSDSPGLVLVSQPLTGDNYASWSRAMVIALSAKNKIGFIDGTIVKPDADVALLQSWIRNNNMVMSWLLNSVSKEIFYSIIFSESAMEIWTDLKERFQQHNNGPRIFQLRCQLFSLRQNQDTVSAYFTKLKSLWEELNNYYGRGKCTCCGVNWQMEYIMTFLMGLNESFAHVRRQVLLMDPLPTINKVFSLISQEERQRNIVIPSSVKAFNFDDVYGHTVKTTCYKIHGDDVGALSDFFQNLQPGQCQRLFSLLTTHLASSSSNVFMPTSSSSYKTGIASLSNQHTWIIDSGASHHVCSYSTAFISLHPVSSSTINLPNGTSISVQYSGDVRFDYNIILKDVLYVPQFHFNLLSISALTMNSQLSVHFYHDHFMIQEIPSLKMIGRGNKIEGLYVIYLHSQSMGF